MESKKHEAARKFKLMLVPEEFFNELPLEIKEIVGMPQFYTYTDSGIKLYPKPAGDIEFFVGGSLMNDFKKDDIVYFFEFIDCDKCYPLEIQDMLVCSEKLGLLDEYSRNNAIFGKSKNELIDNFIKALEKMKDECQKSWPSNMIKPCPECKKHHDE